MKWHDLLGAVLVDFFDGTPYSVDTEADLSLKKQYLDLVVIRKGNGEMHRPLPDGMAPLAKYNLISFKSHQDIFDAWALFELIGHYVNYRKKVSPSLKKLLPVEDFRMFGIAARFPDTLAKEMSFAEHQPGVYDIACGPLPIRLLVIRDLEKRPENAMLELFSTVPDQIEYACQKYRPYSRDTTTIIDKLIRQYRKEDVNMATTMNDIYRKILREAPVKDRLDGLTPEDILQVVPAEELLKGIPPSVKLKGIPPEEIAKYLEGFKESKQRAKKSRKSQK